MSSESEDKSHDVGPLPVMSTDSGVGDEGLAPDNQTNQPDCQDLESSNNNEPPPLEDPPSYEGHTPAPEPPSEENYSGQEFPVKVLTSLDEQLNRPKWVVPVRPGDELEKLLKFSIVMCREGRDVNSEPCQRFFRDGLSTSFVRILTDEAVSTWKPDIQRDIYNNTKLLVELCTTKLDQDWFVLLELLGTALNPNSKWQLFNCNMLPDTCPKGTDVEKLFAFPVEGKNIKVYGWLLDMLNYFGKSGGFQTLHDRIVKGDNLTVPLVAALIKPMGYCADYISERVFQTFLVPVVDKVISFLKELSDEALKKESTSEAKSDTFSSIMKSLRHLCRRIPAREDIETFRLKMILRLLQIASFSGKMNALNEINKIVPSVTYHPHFKSQDDDQLQADKLAAWIKENNVLVVVFRDNLHQTQYVEKLDRIVRFCIKEKVLGMEDLDMIWSCQDGKHEIIVKNVHDLLVKLAWDFSPEQLDHLFGCFQRSWVGASKKQCDELLEFIRHLAEDDKEGVMATKVLNLLWNLARREDCPTDTMDHALNAHIKILDYSCSQERESQKLQWLQWCMEELRSNEKWVIPALKQMKEICMLYLESPVNYTPHHRSTQFYYRNEIISHLDTNYHLLSHICSNLETYMQSVRKLLEVNPDLDPETLCLDGRFNHFNQLQSRLDFVRFSLKDGQLWLGHQQALMVWESLADRPAFPSDREACFRWFAKLVSDEPDIEPETAKRIFTENVHKIPPQHLTENGFRCFDRFFRMVNINERRLVAWRRGFVTENVDLVGLEYLWKSVLVSPEAIVHKPIELLKDVYTNLSTKLQSNQVHLEFIKVCMMRLQRIYEGLQQYQPGEIEQEPQEVQQGYNTEVNKLVRCLALLKEYILDCDEEYSEERGIPPHGKAAWGRPMTVIVRYLSHHGQPPEDFELWTQANASLAQVRRHIMQKLKLSGNNHLELSVGNELLRQNEDKRLVASVPLRDRMVITAKLLFTNVSETSMNSSDNSEDSSEGSPSGHDGPNVEMEKMLPSVLISSDASYIKFLLTVCDFAVLHKHLSLRDNVRSLLKLLPTGLHLWNETLDHCRTSAQLEGEAPFTAMRKYVVTTSPATTLYRLEACHTLMMPSADFREMEGAEFQAHFVQCGGLKLLLALLVDKNFLSEADTSMKRSAFLCMMKMLKLLLVSSAYACIMQVVYTMKKDPQSVTTERRSAVTQLQSALEQIIPASEVKLKSTSMSLAKDYFKKLVDPLPDLSVVKALQMLSWAAGCGNLALIADPSNIHETFVKFNSSGRTLDTDDTFLSRDCLEVLCYCMAISPTILETLQNSVDWRQFVQDILLLTRNRLIRVCAADQFYYIVTKCNTNTALLISFISNLFSTIEGLAKEHANTSGEYFRLLARLLNHANHATISIQGVDKLLETELKWLLKVRETTLESGQCPVESSLLDGHLSLTVELLAFRSVSERYQIGSHPDGQQFIKKLVLDFLFPASRLVREARTNPDKAQYISSAVAVCTTTDCTLSTFKLINALCVGSKENIITLQELLTQLFYSGSELPLVEWEYLPHVGPRPGRGFVGLKNAGATCYMNAVLQQLFMISPVRNEVLGVGEAALFLREIDEKAERQDKEKEANRKNKDELDAPDDPPLPSPSDADRKDTHKMVFTQLQSIFGHLMESRLQFHVPKGFWRDFRLWGDRVNLREQHDAFEFFNCLVDSLDEGFKSYGSPARVSHVLGGSYADQKICKGCPHRYSREEPFTALNVEIRNQQHLFESLDAFVKGDLLEGANAYHCEKCDKKVDTVKRLCIKKLPKVLVIQLKRFDYDWERETAVKFNDYFEFPREFDMAPYTAATLAKTEGGEGVSSGNMDSGDKPSNTPGDEPGDGVSTKYRLKGIVVHSGQASGGHYYSFIQVRKPPGSNTPKWFKFDDGDVTEAKIEDEEEFKAQAFGGDYTGEVYDHVLKKTHYRRQKRWWSAYLLFYDRLDQESAFDECLEKMSPLPGPIQQLVQKQNMEFNHNKGHFNYSYFHFMKQLLNLNYNYIRAQLEQDPSKTAELESLGLRCVQLATTFLFHCGFHTKKTLRGPASDWYEAIQPYLMYSMNIRHWFVDTVFLQHKGRFCEYLLECPSVEIRNVFAKLLTFLCWVTNKDPKIEVEVTTHNGIEKSQTVFSEIALNGLLQLLKKEVSDHSRHLQQYFQVFLNYASKGSFERKQLLRLGVPSLFIAVALDEGPGPPMRSPYTDLSKLYAVVSILVRCCDVTGLQKGLQQDKEPLPNPYADPELCLPLANDLQHWLYERTTNSSQSTTFVKKLIEDSCSMDETVRFLAFCCWENWSFSVVVINELLAEVNQVQAFDLRPYFDLFTYILTLSDTWQHHRLLTSLKGFTHHSDGLIAVIQHGQNHYQKKAYLCIKFLIHMCNRCHQLQKILNEDSYLKQVWSMALVWLQTEMDRRPYTGTGYSYSSWSPPAQSNEASNGYFLERSNSAKLTLKRAKELFPLPEPPAESREEEQEIVPGGDPDAGMPAEAAETHGTEHGGDHENEPERPPSPPLLDTIDEVNVTDENTSSQQLQETD
ncbi:probable ubiquitin carboxyl-terminal hydrolase FAF-X [Halichondria panicea]|uniref:probable ubiquitin carboxyl-terminal hydrolase FAF-X n=1 Tax=Halichondria panicea TaxID=6063 RepID=UPI00312B62DA